jgi:hypothetical protein
LAPALAQSPLEDIDDRFPSLCNWDGERIDYDAAVDALIVDGYP